MFNFNQNLHGQVSQKNAHQLCANLVAFINANGGVHKWALQLNKNAFTANNTLFGGVNAKGTLWQPMLKAQQTNNSVAGAILWACVNGANVTALSNAPKQVTCPKATLKYVNGTTIPKVAKPIPLSQIQAVSQLSGSSILANSGSANGCRQNALSAILIGSFSYIAKHTYGTNFGTLVPLAK